MAAWFYTLFNDVTTPYKKYSDVIEQNIKQHRHVGGIL